MLYINRILNKIYSKFFERLIPLLHHDIKIGREFKIRKNVSINSNGGEIIIGQGVFINSNSSINSKKSIAIGDHVIIGENVHIYDHNHRYDIIDEPICKQGFKVKEVVIGDNCWLATNVTILMGVHIGENCIIWANCLVYKDVPPNTIIMQKQEYISRERKKYEN